MAPSKDKGLSGGPETTAAEMPRHGRLWTEKELELVRALYLDHAADRAKAEVGSLIRSLREIVLPMTPLQRSVLALLLKQVAMEPHLAREASRLGEEIAAGGHHD